MIHFVTHHGLPLLFAVVLLESFGTPLPGESALIAFGAPQRQPDNHDQHPEKPGTGLS